MLFNSYIFLFQFLPVVFVVFVLAAFYAGAKARNLVLILFSIYFYSYTMPSDLWIVAFSILTNYAVTRFFVKYPDRKRPLVVMGVIFNLTILGCYKYLNFFISILNHIPNLNIANVQTHLPLAISFFTFQQICFIVDQYRASESQKVGFARYAAAVLFFPHLIAGPLVEYRKLIPQFAQDIKWSKWLPRIYMGIFVFVLGLSKKVILADSLSPFVDLVFGPDVNLREVNYLETVLGVISYTLQLYFDFSGYSDMAVGLGLMFGIILPFNFNSPYKATSIIDFWRRWHITLSNFLREYLYIPLGGSREGVLKHYRNLFLTMLIGGIWHGAGWHFVIWGSWHGVWICLVHFMRRNYPQVLSKIFGFRWVNQVLTLLVVVVGWVFFRAQDSDTAFEILNKLVRVDLTALYAQIVEVYAKTLYTSLYIMLGTCIVLAGPNTIAIYRFFRSLVFMKNRFLLLVLTGFCLAVLFNICLLLMSKPVTFLYYQF